ncbi:MAG TPA: sulfotransferase [Tepidisphaeraceae bacterium]|nr:sulfotransferase [Tepidisphaeraceae bacterium]
MTVDSRLPTTNPTPAQRLRDVLKMQPNNADAHGELARVLLMDRQPEQAEHHARRAVELAPQNHELAAGLAAVLDAIGKTDQAAQIVERLLAAGYESDSLALIFSRVAPSLDRKKDALALILRLLQTGSTRPPRELSPLHFAAALLLDAMERYDEAFAQAYAANVARGVTYDPGPTDRLIRDFSNYFTRPVLRNLPRATHGSEAPVFIVGTPRSGTTLLEQILASHPSIHGAGEIDWILRAWESAVHRNYDAAAPLSHSLDRLSVRDADELAEAYLQPLHALDPAAERIINKSPSNFMHLGLIEILFPMARVIHCRRDPLDTCLSCYMTDFAVGNDFTNSLSSAGHFYNHYAQMMAHWRGALNLRMLEVDYEKVVADVEGQTRRMLDFLEMPWDPACLQFYENKRFVATASNAQVRRPIYRSSVGRWKHYDRHLGPLKKALASDD